MKQIWIAIGIIVVALVIFVLYCCMVIASEEDRRLEEYELRKQCEKSEREDTE